MTAENKDKQTDEQAAEVAEIEVLPIQVGITPGQWGFFAEGDMTPDRKDEIMAFLESLLFPPEGNKEDVKLGFIILTDEQGQVPQGEDDPVIVVGMTFGANAHRNGEFITTTANALQGHLNLRYGQGGGE